MGWASGCYWVCSVNGEVAVSLATWFLEQANIWWVAVAWVFQSPLGNLVETEEKELCLAESDPIYTWILLLFGFCNTWVSYWYLWS